MHTDDSICLTSSSHKIQLIDPGCILFSLKNCIRRQTNRNHVVGFWFFFWSFFFFFPFSCLLSIVSESFPSLLPAPPGTAGRDNPSEGGRGQRRKQTGARSHLWNKLPLGRLHAGVRHPGAAGARKWGAAGTGLYSSATLSVGSASLTLRRVKFLS